jgi:hypothetical protein
MEKPHEIEAIQMPGTNYVDTGSVQQDLGL